MKKRIIQFLKKKFSPKQRAKLKYYYAFIMSRIFFFANLNTYASWFETDKWNNHWYTQHYHRHFKKMRRKKIKLLEIGVGGHNAPMHGAHSLRMWKAYFLRAKIFGLDIHNKKQLEEKRIKIFQADQTDKIALQNINREYGPFDIIIDDGSHHNDHVITTFNLLFPLLKKGGIYAVEDMQTAYWQNFGGNSEEINDPKTSVNFFKNLVHCLNHSEFIKPGYKATYFDKNIVQIHFYHNMVFIYKDDNNEGSNMVVNNEKIEYKHPKHFLTYKTLLNSK